MKGIHKETKAVRAIKIINKEKIPDTGQFKMELQIMRTLDHPNVIKLYEVYEDKKYIYFVME
jgi:calcium-dependent protein kinase